MEIGPQTGSQIYGSLGLLMETVIFWKTEKAWKWKNEKGKLGKRTINKYVRHFAIIRLRCLTLRASPLFFFPPFKSVSTSDVKTWDWRYVSRWVLVWIWGTWKISERGGEGMSKMDTNRIQRPSLAAPVKNQCGSLNPREWQSRVHGPYKHSGKYLWTRKSVKPTAEGEKEVLSSFRLRLSYVIRVLTPRAFIARKFQTTLKT